MTATVYDFAPTRTTAPTGDTIAATSSSSCDVRPDDGEDCSRALPAVVELDTRRRIPCPQCDGFYTVRELDGHLRWDCKPLAAKRAHPSTWKPGA